MANNKITPWVKIKADYLSGVTPKELSLKYGVSAKTIHEKASKENWVDERTSIYKNLQEITQDRIERITNLALKRLEDVLSEGEIKTNDLVSAIGKALDISGLKKESQNLNVNNEPIEVKFI